MSKKRESIWEKQASRKTYFVCFIIIIAAIICFGGAYLQFNSKKKAPDEIWTDDSSSYDQKVEEQRNAEQEINNSREGEPKE